MRIGGFVKFSLIDYPGRVAAVVFTQGCNFRCPYCHNPELVYPEMFVEPIPLDYVLGFLGKRKGLIDGVVFSGGEPTLQEDLLETILEVRSLGYAVKLDTNGGRPDILVDVLPYVDYVAMDIKAPFDGSYGCACGIPLDDYEIRRSMLLIRAAGVKYEFRTTFHPEFMPVEETEKIRSVLGPGETYIVKKAEEIPAQKLKG